MAELSQISGAILMPVNSIAVENDSLANIIWAGHSDLSILSVFLKYQFQWIA